MVSRYYCQHCWDDLGPQQANIPMDACPRCGATDEGEDFWESFELVHHTADYDEAFIRWKEDGGVLIDVRKGPLKGRFVVHGFLCEDYQAEFLGWTMEEVYALEPEWRVPRPRQKRMQRTRIVGQG